ncbi:hypothetical protein E2C01_072966 [Portunus trituberculatus]|uniref:Uncharacterized protein n=1 Tax=Portunus trituberculatus TaxID=210409 RepID=A0A5B7I9B7_PORTR|nr:hypothetical protein [Portunus trituberculatus]
MRSGREGGGEGVRRALMYLLETQVRQPIRGHHRSAKPIGGAGDTMTFGDGSQSQRQKLNRLQRDLINRWGVKTRGQKVAGTGGERSGGVEGEGGVEGGWITLPNSYEVLSTEVFCMHDGH